MKKIFEHNAVVVPDWIDHNGHMNVAFFVLAFDEATDAVYERWGLGLEYPDVSGCSVFTLGMNVDYRSELFEGDAIRILTRLVDYDEKRIHYFHEMYHADSDRLAATNECLCMNVGLESRKSEAFPAGVLELLKKAHRPEPRPEGFGRALEIRRR
ncbi:MAG: thioesterase family protein [Woeseiaceae bacterium]|nr:thioesterase family protein [Woeseiaceae bacterium]